MFEHAERGLKAYATFNFVCGVIIGIAGVIFSFLLHDLFIVLGLLLSALWFFVVHMVSLVIYAFAEILENLKSINYNTKAGFAKEVYDYDVAMQQEREAQEKKVAEEAEAAYEAERIAEEVAARRFADYWSKHAEEKVALLEKKRIAEEKLNELGNFAIEERKAIRSLIHSIDEELNKPR